jgi:hypothetical protein
MSKLNVDTSVLNSALQGFAPVALANYFEPTYLCFCSVAIEGIKNG